MFRSPNLRIAIGVWFSLLVAVAVIGALAGASITLGNSVLWLLAGIVPPAVMLIVWRGAPPETVAEILHTADRRD